MDMFAEMTRQDPERGIQEYLDRFFHEPPSWNHALERMGLQDIADGDARRQEHP